MIDVDLSGRTALITGASAGIGRATACRLADAGANVVVAARRQERLDDIVAEIESDTSGRGLAVPTDVTDPDAVDELIAAAVDAFGGLDVVVCNAGLAREGGVEALDTDAYRQMMSVNCDGAFYTARAALPHLRESAGNLVFLASFSGQYPRPDSVVYAATKWWTRGFAHSLAADVGGDDVGVTTINPTEVRTEFGDEDGAASKDQFAPGEVTEADEVAEAVLFTAAQDAPTSVFELDLYRRDKLSHF